jgi:hypothetical protein
MSAGASRRPEIQYLRERPRLIVAIVAALVVFLVAWVLISDDDQQAPPPSAAAAVSVAELRAVAASTDHRVYWAGRRRNYTYELTRTRDRSVYIRYLPPGAPVGSPRPDYLTVGSYPNPDAFGTVRQAARRQGAIVRRISRGGLAVANRARPQSVYFAYPDSNVLVEVYDRSPARARRLVTSGRIDAIRR